MPLGVKTQLKKRISVPRIGRTMYIAYSVVLAKVVVAKIEAPAFRRCASPQGPQHRSSTSKKPIKINKMVDPQGLGESAGVLCLPNSAGALSY